MNRPLTELITHRVRALAYVALTRREDLLVTDVTEQGELDLIARIAPPRERQLRFLGVILRGTAKSLGAEDASKELNAYFRQTGKNRGPVQYPFPVIALIFSMENDEGFYDWRSRPFLGEGRTPKMETKPSLECKSFTRDDLDEVVERSNEWYDALFSFFASE